MKIIKFLMLLSTINLLATNSFTPKQLEFIDTGVCNGCNLSNLDFTPYISALNQLAHISLKCANLSGSDLTGLSSKSIDLSCPNISSTNATNLTNTNLSQSNLPNLNLQGVNITGTNFTNAQLPGANFSNLNIGHLAAEGANLSHAIFDGANLQCSTANPPTCGSMLYGANLTGASFKGTNLTGADLGGTELAGAIFSPSTILSYVEFDHAHAENIDLSGTTANCISAKGTDFTGAKFDNSTLVLAPMLTPVCASSFNGAILNNASFTNVKNLPSIDFTNAQLLGTTGLDGLNTPYNNITKIINSAAKGAVECNGCDLTGVDFTIQIQDLFSGSNWNGSLSSQSLVQLMQGLPVTMQCSVLDNANMIGLSTPKLDLSCPSASGENTTSMNHTNLATAQIPGALLQNATMNNAILDQANLTGANLEQANLYYASLKGTNFTGAKLTSAGLGNNDLTGTIFVEADLSNLPDSITYSPAPGAASQVVYSGLKMANAGTLTLAHFEGANMPGIDLSNMSGNVGQLHFGVSPSGKATNLTGAHFDNTDLSCGPNCGTAFNGATLTSATFTGTNLTGADFTGATLDQATFDSNTKFADNYAAHTKLDGISCHGTNFSGVNLTAGNTNITMTNANCSGTSSSNATNFSNMTINNVQMKTLQAQYAAFNSSTLTNTDLTGSDLASASFDGATFNGVNLDGVNLTNANLANIQLQGNAITNINSSDSPTTNLAGSSISQYSNLWDWLGDTLNTGAAGDWMVQQCQSGAQPVCAAFCHMGAFESQHVFDIFKIPNKPTLNNQQAFTDFRCSSQNPTLCCQQLVFDADMNASTYMNLPQFQQ